MRCPHCAADNIPGVDVCDNCGSDLAGLDLPEAEGGFRGRLLTARLADLKLSPAVVVPPSESVRAAVERMREAGSGCVLVRSGDELVGLFNERHLLARVLRPGLDPSATPVSEVMSRDPIELDPDDPPAYAIHCMVAYDRRHLPVTSGGRILGYVSVRNILAFLVEDVMAETAEREPRPPADA